MAGESDRQIDVIEGLQRQRPIGSPTTVAPQCPAPWLWSPKRNTALLVAQGD